MHNKTYESKHSNPTGIITARDSLSAGCRLDDNQSVKYWPSWDYGCLCPGVSLFAFDDICRIALRYLLAESADDIEA